METGPVKRPVWPFVLAAVLLLLLVVIVARGCMQNYGASTPVILDTLEHDVGIDSTGADGDDDTVNITDTAGDAEPLPGTQPNPATPVKPSPGGLP